MLNLLRSSGALSRPRRSWQVTMGPQGPVVLRRPLPWWYRAWLVLVWVLIAAAFVLLVYAWM